MPPAKTPAAAVTSSGAASDVEGKEEATLSPAPRTAGIACRRAVESLERCIALGAGARWCRTVRRAVRRHAHLWRWERVPELVKSAPPGPVEHLVV